MEIRFINHSSIIIDTGSEKILCDPWYKGTAFANGWRLLMDEVTDINELKFDKLWISHEHPDHFSIPTLKSLKIKKPVLYQQTEDKKVKKYLEAEGHTVNELPHNKGQIIAGCEVTSIVTEGYDSCLLVDDGKVKFLNINDAQLDKEAEIAKIVKHTPIDLISIQFHYANWAGNIGDEEIPVFKRQYTINQIKKICEVCDTKDVILFASFIYYAHEENFYWNQSFDHIKLLIEELKTSGLNPILMLPGQAVRLDRSRNYKKESDKNHLAYSFWKDQHEAIQVKEYARHWELTSIAQLYKSFIAKLHDKNNIAKYGQTFLKDFRLNCKVTDLNKNLSLGLYEQTFEDVDQTLFAEYDVSLSSEALAMLLQNDFSLGSITIASRIQFNYETAFKLYFFFLIPYRNNLGIYLNDSISKDLNFEAFKSNGVLKPIFHFNKEAERKFDTFNTQLEKLN
ncbi:MBL fold metallo-hydrolase [bacterium]|nr:MBL fold metallo-hydrolase [bacterium]